jgi:hypothetical protein
MMPVLLGKGGASVFIYSILPKALGEVAIMSFLMATLVGNRGFNDFVGKFFMKTYIIPTLKTQKSESKT